MTLLQPRSLSGIVSLEARNRSVGTGFLYARFFAKLPNRPFLFIATNSHVVDAVVSHIRFNRTDGGTGLVPVNEVTRPGVEWSRHETADVAVLPLPRDSPLSRSSGADHMYFPDNHGPTTEQWQHVKEGSGVFVLGFPLGLTGERRNYPIVRHGIIARIQDWQRRDAPSFLIDSTAFPGNSGGPVILQPEAVGLTGAEGIKEPLLLGIVSKYLTYQDVAVSRQTGQPRVVFEENSGLAEVVPIDMAKECCDAALSALGLHE